MDKIKQRVIFVGLHNKPNMMPLDILTKTGKLINRIIKELPKRVKIVKTNLFDADYLPESCDFHIHVDEWYWKNLPVKDDIIVLLGAMTHKEFGINHKNKIKVAHPASKRSHVAMDEYVENTVKKINLLIV